jgi:hypothetical protein
MHVGRAARILAAAAGGTILALDVEPNNDFEHATHVAVPLGHGTGCIDPAADIDTYAFHLDDPTPLFVSARAKGGARFRVSLFDAGQARLHEGSDMIDVAVVPAGDYFVQVQGLEKDCYELHIACETRMPPPAGAR